MTNYLKGNYRVPTNPKIKITVKKKGKTIEEKFEEESLKKLGGSIAFVIKSKSFVWEGEEDEKTK